MKLKAKVSLLLLTGIKKSEYKYMYYAFLREIYNNMVPRMQLYMDCLVERHHISFWAKDITLI